MKASSVLFSWSESPQVNLTIGGVSPWAWGDRRLVPAARVGNGPLSFYRRLIGSDRLPHEDDPTILDSSLSSSAPKKVDVERELELVFAGLSFGPKRHIVSPYAVKAYWTARKLLPVSEAITIAIEANVGQWEDKVFKAGRGDRDFFGHVSYAEFPFTAAELLARAILSAKRHAENEATARLALERKSIDLRIVPTHIRSRLLELAGDSNHKATVRSVVSKARSYSLPILAGAGIGLLAIGGTLVTVIRSRS